MFYFSNSFFSLSITLYRILYIHSSFFYFFSSSKCHLTLRRPPIFFLHRNPKTKIMLLNLDFGLIKLIRGLFNILNFLLLFSKVHLFLEWRLTHNTFVDSTLLPFVFHSLLQPREFDPFMSPSIIIRPLATFGNCNTCCVNVWWPMHCICRLGLYAVAVLEELS